ncbi:MAG TPA: alpha/beta fold hydrolase [Streptosporangiaceae bacterium]|nr:alpha/beta fold hydrolase [Streptosporangiaceae bacterium]
MSEYVLRPAIDGARGPIVYVPGVGGRTSFIAQWQHPESPVAAAIWKTPGRSTPVVQRGGELARALAEQGADEVMLVGHSLGALIAFEAAVRSPGRFRALVLLAQYPPHAMRRYSHEGRESLSALADLEAAVPSELAQAAGFLEAMREVWLNDYKAAAEYEPSARTDVRIVAVGAAQDKLSCDLETLAQWDRYGTRIQVAMMPGGHNFVETLTGDEFREMIYAFVS